MTTERQPWQLLSLADEAAAARLEAELWQLMERQSRRYTGGHSTSLTEETAEGLLQSIHYCLRRYLAEQLAPAAQLLHEHSLQELFQLGQALLQEDLLAGRELLRRVRASRAPLENLAYADTLRALGDFFPRYDPEFAAQETPCMIDYPLLLPCNEQPGGVLYINGYLQRLLWENECLSRFSPVLQRRLLAFYVPDPVEQLINLWEPVFVNALGLVLLNEDPRPLEIRPTQQEWLLALLLPLAEEELHEALAEAAASLCRKLALPDVAARAYLAAAALALTPRLQAACQAGDCRHIFLSFA